MNVPRESRHHESETLEQERRDEETDVWDRRNRRHYPIYYRCERRWYVFTGVGFGPLDIYTMEFTVFFVRHLHWFNSENSTPLIGPKRSTRVILWYPGTFSLSPTSQSLSLSLIFHNTTTKCSTSFPGFLFLTSLGDLRRFLSFCPRRKFRDPPCVRTTM